MQYVGQTKRKLKERFREHFNNYSKMPDFDVFSLLDIRRRNRRSRGKRKNGNLKRKHKNKTFWTLTGL